MKKAIVTILVAVATLATVAAKEVIVPLKGPNLFGATQKQAVAVYDDEEFRGANGFTTLRAFEMNEAFKPHAHEAWAWKSWKTIAVNEQSLKDIVFSVFAENEELITKVVLNEGHFLELRFTDEFDGYEVEDLQVFVVKALDNELFYVEAIWFDIRK